jgi:lambda family phage portal protein
MFDPNHPNSAYAAFIKAVLRGIASGLGVSYNTLANDLEGVNFSSIRTGVLEDREAWKARQVWMIENVVSPIFRRWLRAGLLSGAISMDRGSRLSSANFDKLVAHTFQGRRWPWVDPQKDMNANTMAVAERFRSRSDVIRELGDDPAEVWAEIAAENELLEELGIKPAPVVPGDDPADDEENDDETENENETGDAGEDEKQ